MSQNAYALVALASTDILNDLGEIIAIPSVYSAPEDGAPYGDTDQTREVAGAVDVIISALDKAGMKYDEGPLVGGDYGPYVQSERKQIYLDYAQKLIESGNAYYYEVVVDYVGEVVRGHAVRLY